jgi:hypothetical protein
MVRSLPVAPVDPGATHQLARGDRGSTSPAPHVTNVAGVAVVILAVALGLAVVVAVGALLRLRTVSSRAAELAARADGAEAKVVAGLEREAALEERHEAVAAERTALESRVTALEQDCDQLRQSVLDGSESRAALEEEAGRLGADLALAREAAREADAAAVAAVAQADAAGRDLVNLRRELDRARSELDAARGAPVSDDAERPPVAAELVEGLWALERARTERTWRQSVALDPTAPGPFVVGVDPARASLDVELAALREDVGSVLEADWRIEQPLGDADGLLLVRAAQELLAAAARTVEEGVLVVDRDDDVLLLGLSQADGTPVDLAELVGEALGGGRVEDGLLRLPAA